jgi:hypothetical protein
MLDPFYLQPSSEAEGASNIQDYQVIAYSQVNEYVLIHWKVSERIAIRGTNIQKIFFSGQTLWKGKTHIFTRAGKTRLLKPKATRLLPGTAPKINKNWLEEAAKEGQPYYGIPEAIAAKLESPASLRYL